MLLVVLCGGYVFRSLTVISTEEKIKDRQQAILNRYDRMLYHLQRAQTGLYGYEAGHEKNTERLAGPVDRVTELISLTIGEYALYADKTACNYCHFEKTKNVADGIAGRIHKHDATLASVGEKVGAYREAIRRVAASHDAGLSRSLVKEAAKDGERTIALIDTLRSSMLKMNERMQNYELGLVKRSMYSIMLVIALSVLLCTIIAVVLVRSITRPVNMLVHGIERVSSGDYNSKVVVEAEDEIGFLARTFNRMTDNLTEVTKQKETLLAELRDLNSGLEQRVHEAKEQLRIAHERMLRNETLSAIGTLASGVAHELATPISSIMNYFQLVKDRIPGQDGLAEDIQIIENELRRCNGILRGMLDFARASEKERVLTDINTLVRDVLALIKYQPEYKSRIAIKEDLWPGRLAISVIAGQLKQVLTNVIVNALQSMPEGGHLDVSTSLTADREKVLISVSDTGNGIPGDELEKISQPFYTTRKSGTGLGLSISYEIIRAHNGDIEITSEPGKGTTVQISLPAFQERRHEGAGGNDEGDLSVEGRRLPKMQA